MRVLHLLHFDSATDDPSAAGVQDADSLVVQHAESSDQVALNRSKQEHVREDQHLGKDLKKPYKAVLIQNREQNHANDAKPQY